MSPITDLTDNVVAITGAASGIGRGLARAFAERGAHIVASDVHDEDNAETVSLVQALGRDAIAVRCDVADRAQIAALADAAYERFGQVDVVCANAGIGPPQRVPVLDIDEADARRVLDVNLIGAWATMAEFGTRMVAAEAPGHIMVTASENTIGIPAPQMGFYTASKHALLGLTDLMRNELPDRIGVSILMPGIVATKLTAALGAKGDDDPEFGLSAIKMGRHTVQAMLDGEYYIAAHPPMVELVDERATGMREAFERQAPRFDGDEFMDTRHAMRVVLGRLGTSAAE